jgi:hypothetical protein
MLIFLLVIYVSFQSTDLQTNFLNFFIAFFLLKTKEAGMLCHKPATCNHELHSITIVKATEVLQQRDDFNQHMLHSITIHIPKAQKAKRGPALLTASSTMQ